MQAVGRGEGSKVALHVGDATNGPEVDVEDEVEGLSISVLDKHKSKTLSPRRRKIRLMAQPTHEFRKTLQQCRTALHKSRNMNFPGAV
jgi:hypothetical protein